MPAGAGLVVGLALSGATTRALSTVIPLNQQYDPRTFFIVVPMLIARRAAGVLRARPPGGESGSESGAEGRVSGQPTHSINR